MPFFSSCVLSHCWRSQLACCEYFMPLLGKAAGPNGALLHATFCPRCSRPPSLCRCATQPPHQFKTFKFEMPEAVEGRERVKSLGDDVKVNDKRVKVCTSKP